MVPVAKKSQDKVSVGGRKYALRRLGPSGRAQAEVLGIGATPAHDDNDRSLLVELVRDGERVHTESLETARDRLRASRAELPASATQLSKGDPVIDTVYETPATEEEHA